MSTSAPVTVVAFLKRTIAFYARHGITVEQLLTDNGSAYRSTLHAIACRSLGIKHLRTRAYRPQTNGKAERFIRTLLGSWAYGSIYRTSTERTAALTDGFGTTTINDDTQPSATTRPLPGGPTFSGLTARRRCSAARSWLP